MMPDTAINEFFKERKAAWLKKNLKPSMDDLEQSEKTRECEHVFSPREWLPSAAKRAGQISISTHPCTFSHPSARKNNNGYASSIIATRDYADDGFLKSGNVEVASDAVGNAAALDVYKFLMLRLADGQTLLQHIEQDSDQAKTLLTLDNDIEQSYEVLKQGFLAMVQGDDEVVTSSKIKQVYFPSADDQDGQDYHQLSILTASGLVFEMRKRLDAMRFGIDAEGAECPAGALSKDELKQAREKRRNNEYFEKPFKEIYDLTSIGYGGTKPQNISVLNNQNGGKAHLLMSAPPILKRRDLHFPTRDAFSQSLRYQQCRALFFKLDALYRSDQRNYHIRAERDEYYQLVVDYVVEKSWQLRAVGAEQFHLESTQLPKAQRIWLVLDNQDDQKTREQEDAWLDEILASVTQFIFHGYEKTLGKKAFKLGEAEHRHMAALVEKNREVLR